MLSYTGARVYNIVSVTSLAGPGSETRVWLTVMSSRLQDVLLTTSSFHLTVVASLLPTVPAV